MFESVEVKIAIVDDKLASREKIKERLENLESILENIKFSITLYECGVTFLADKNSYDLILLDYEMPNKNGIQVAKTLEIREPRPYVVFISGYDNLDKPMQKATQLRCVVGFIFKSDSEKEFQFQVENALKTLLNICWIEFEYYLVEPVDPAIERQREKRIYYNKKLDARRITHVTTATDTKNAVIIHTENETFKANETLQSIFDKLPNKEFEYSDRGVIIHLGSVHSIGKKNIYLTTDDECPLKPKYREKFRKSYEEYLLQGLDDA